MNDMRKIDVLKNAFKANNIPCSVHPRLDRKGDVLQLSNVSFYFNENGDYEKHEVEISLEDIEEIKKENNLADSLLEE